MGSRWSDFLKPGRTLVMGVLNVTPDSFSDGGLFLACDQSVEHAKQMATDGADIIDIGGQSTRPGAESISAEEELERVRPVIEELTGAVDIPLSIDTYQPEVAEECLKLGARILNDVCGLRDPRMMEVAAHYEAPIVLMHMRGVPQTMQEDIRYDDVVGDIKEFFAQRTETARKFGISEIMIDPGIGFGKTAEHNLEILRRLGEFRELGYPVMVGPSRKSFIGKITGLPVDQRVEGTIAASVIAVKNGADAVRVHDVRECKRALQVADAIECPATSSSWDDCHSRDPEKK